MGSLESDDESEGLLDFFDSRLLRLVLGFTSIDETIVNLSNVVTGLLRVDDVPIDNLYLKL